MILIISTCKDRLHDLEFVKPVKDIIKKDCIVKHYSKLKKDDLKTAEKIIICGTSLKDNEFIKDIRRFDWIKEETKPVLGICAGMQIIGMVFGAPIKKKTEIGFYQENFRKFLALEGEEKVYHLHNYYVDFSKLKDFETFSDSKIAQAVRYNNLYGVLFHPEVRQEGLISHFVEKI